MASADQLLDQAGVSPQGADEMLDAGGVAPDANTLGQQAAQGASVKPIAPVPADRIAQFAAKYGLDRSGYKLPPANAAPAASATEEPTFAPSDVPPTVAAPEAAAHVQLGLVQPTAQDFDAIKAAQDSLATLKSVAVSRALGGADFDSGTGDNRVWERARMGLMSSAVDRAKYLQDNLPPGTDVKVINVRGIGPMVVFRPLGATAYQPVKGTEDVAGKIGDALGALPSVATQVGLAAATDGESLLVRLLSQAVGGAGERALELGANKAQGYDAQPISADAANAAGSGGVAAAGELGASALSNLVGKGGGVFAPTDVGAKRMAAQEALQKYDPNLKALTAFQLGHPLLESKGNRLAAINPTLGNIAGQQGNTLADLLNKSVMDATGGAKPALGDASSQVGGVQYPGLQAISDTLKTEAEQPLAHVPEVAPTEGGRALGNIYTNALKPVASTRPSEKYATLLQGMSDAPQHENGVVPIDLTGAQKVAAKEAAPVYGQAPPVKAIEETPVMGLGGMGEPVQLGTKTEEVTKPGEIQVAGGIKPALQNIVDKLRGLNPQNGTGPMSERTVSPYEAVAPIRSALGEASVYNPMAANADRATSTQAGRILNGLDQSINDAAAQHGMKGPLDAARNATTFSKEILDNPKAIQARSTTEPETNMSLADPSNRSFLANTERLSKATGQTADYAKFQNAFKTSLKRNPDQIDAFLSGAAESPDGATRLAGADMGAIKQYNENVKQLPGSLTNTLLNGTKDFNERARIAVDNTSAADLKDLVTRAGGQDSPVGSNLRGALFQKILSKGMNDEGGLDMGRTVKAISDVMKSGQADALLNPEELKRLGDIRTYAAGGESLSKGLGSSIYGSEVAGATMTPVSWITSPVRTLKALGELAEARVQNATWASNAGTRFLFGKPGGSPAVLPRAAGAGGASYELNKSRQEPSIGGNP